MKKFSITQLEQVRKNPSAFANQLKSGITESGNFFGRARFLRWQDAVNDFHKTNDLSKAIKYLENSLSGYAENKKNSKIQEEFIESLIYYVDELEKNSYIYLKAETLKIEINEKVMISGRVPLTYMNGSGGFSIHFFSRSNEDWEGELKFPILQKHFADNIFGTDIDKIQVGIYCITDNKFYATTYSSNEIEEADKELENIGDIMFSIL